MKCFLLGSAGFLAMLVLSLAGFGLYAWGQLQSNGSPTSFVGDNDSAATNSDGSPDTASGTVTISKNQLTPEQLALAAKFGIDASEVNITPEMIACARGKLGDTRFEAIVKGASPTSMEAFALVPCI